MTAEDRRARVGASEFPAKEDRVEDGPEPLIEIGWLLLGAFPDAERAAVEDMHKRLSTALKDGFPRFVWRQPVVERRNRRVDDPAPPIELLDQGRRLLHERGWDFCFVVCSADLSAQYRQAATAVVSQAMGVAAFSTARLRDRLGDGTEDTQMRLVRLGLHLLGDLTGLAHAEDPSSPMCAGVDECPGDAAFSASERALLGRRLEEVGDVRLEEDPRTRRVHALRFYLHTLRIGWRDVASAVVQAHPWELPFRLSRLSTGATSALLVLLLTAEAWELGLRQPPLLVAHLSLACLLATSLLLLVRQRLLFRSHRLTERLAVANMTIVIVVVTGMASTYLVLFAVTWLTGRYLVGADLLSAWAPTLGSGPDELQVVCIAGFAATLGLLIGALGASFEGPTYFRHVAFVDEEL